MPDKKNSRENLPDIKKLSHSSQASNSDSCDKGVSVSSSFTKQLSDTWQPYNSDSCDKGVSVSGSLTKKLSDTSQPSISGYCDMNTSSDPPRKTSQSSYVEMSPCDDLLSEQPYMPMENVYSFNKSVDLMHSFGRKNSSFFEFDDIAKKSSETNSPRKHLSLKPCRELSVGREYKKGNKHKDDYAFLDLS